MSEFGQRTCVISSPSKRLVKKILEKMKDRKFKWVYLGEDVSRAISIDEMMRDKGQRIETAEMLQETARSLRQSYIDYIGKLSVERNSLMWWAGRLSEKNPYVSKTFLHACYIKLSMDILKKYSNESLVFLVEKRAARRSILKNLSTCNLKHVESEGESIREALKDLKEFIMYKGWFLLNNIYRIAISKYAYRMQKRVKSRTPLVLIHTIIDRRSFDEKGSYHESYFGGLPDHLKKSGKNVIVVPYVWGTVPYQKTIDRMAKSENVFLVPHAFLSVRDIFCVFFTTLANMPKKMVFPRFGDMDISEVIYEDLKNDRIGMRVASDMLLYYLVKRLKKKQLLIDTVIYTYENQSWEKVLCSAMWKFYPSAYLIGYQHSAFSLMHLNHFFSKYESNIVPLPDRIVTTGRHAKDVFIESGYPDEKVAQGGAVRYVHLLGPKISTKSRKRDKPVILATPSIESSEAVELIWKIFKAFEHRSEYKVVIKCHPVMPFEKISRHLNIKFPEHVVVSDTPVAELLKESNVLLYMDSTTCVEAIAAGVPPVHVESDLSIDLDKLDFNPGVRTSARSAEEIVKRAKDVISMDEGELSKKRKMWNNVVMDLFGSVNDSVYSLFLR